MNFRALPNYKADIEKRNPHSKIRGEPRIPKIDVTFFPALHMKMSGIPTQTPMWYSWSAENALIAGECETR